MIDNNLKKKKKTISFFILFIVFFAIPFMVFIEWNLSTMASNRFNYFYSISIKSTISSIKYSRYNSFKVIDNKSSIYFKSDKYKNKQNRNLIDFYSLATVGDSVFKRINSDTIFLIKDGQRYFFEWHPEVGR